MDFDNTIKESINKIIHESISLYEQQMDIYQHLQQLQQQLQMTQDPNQRAKIQNQIMQLQQQMQMQQQQVQQPQMQGGYEDQGGGENPLAQIGITPQAAATAVGGEVLSRGAGHAVDMAGGAYDKYLGDPVKLAAKSAKEKLASKWSSSPNLRAGLKWGGAAAGVALGGYALLKMKKKRCQNNCYERFTDQNQINDCLKLC